jgi:LacI family transcriptional regulator
LSELGVLDLAHGKATRISQAPFQKNIEIIYAGLTPIDQQEFWAAFYRGIIDEINQTNGFSYSNRVITDANSQEELANLEFKNSVGGLLIGTANIKVIEHLKQYGFSFLMVYERSEQIETSYVSCDYSEVMQQMIDLFIANKREKLAYIGSFEGKTDKGINTDKYDCFIEAVKSHDLIVNPEWHKNAYHLMNEGYEAAKKLLDTGEKPDGIVLSSDVLAPGVYRALHEAGLTIPKDVMIAGCDNLEIGKFLVPSLTTIELSRYEIGRAAAKNLITEIEDGEELIQTNFMPEIVIRESLN